VAVLGDVQQQGLKSAGLWRVWLRGAGLGGCGRGLCQLRCGLHFPGQCPCVRGVSTSANVGCKMILVAFACACGGDEVESGANRQGAAMLRLARMWGGSRVQGCGGCGSEVQGLGAACGDSDCRGVGCILLVSALACAGSVPAKACVCCFAVALMLMCLGTSISTSVEMSLHFLVALRHD